jgi:membrane associated rhomboid family serine protease
MILTVLPILAFLTAFGALWMLQKRSQRLKFPIGTTVLVVVSLVTGTYAAFDAAVSDALGSDPQALSSGEVWRVITPLFTQQGDLFGVIFSLVILAAVGTVVENLLGRWMLFGVFLASGLAGELFAGLTGQAFAGTTVATTGLAAVLLIAGLTDGFASTLTGVFGVICGVILLIAWDPHGVAFFVGGLIGAVYLIVRTVTKRDVGEPSP